MLASWARWPGRSRWLMSISACSLEQADRLAIDDQHLGAQRLLDAHALAAQLAIRRLVGAEREKGTIGVAH